MFDNVHYVNLIGGFARAAGYLPHQPLLVAVRPPGGLRRGRTHAGHRVYRHGGGWPGIKTALVHAADVDATIAVLAPHDDTERRVTLTDALLDLFLPASGYRVTP
jgi:hypothetical protein